MPDEMPRWQARGPYRVGAAEIEAWSDVEDGALAVFAQLPDPVPAQELPVVILSHGLGGSHRGYAPLGAHLASHGYAVLHPQFLDSRDHLLATGALAPVAAGDEAVAAAVRPMLFDPRHWRSRVHRVRAVLDSLATQQHLAARLSPVGVTVAGHSYGAYTTQLMLGARLFGVGCDGDCSGGDRSVHPAIGCGVLISPQGSGDRGLTHRSWEAVTAPILAVTAERDLGPHGEGVPWRREPYDRVASPLKHLAILRGTDHHMGGIATTETDAAESGRGARRSDPAWFRSAVSALVVAFANAVRGDREAGAWLAARPMRTRIDHEYLGWAR